jgi:2-keto-4-pentenoate hydratase/2-oxohepta-3-ene-1,7-dioic acid hydratase in catechol pathway
VAARKHLGGLSRLDRVGVGRAKCWGRQSKGVALRIARFSRAGEVAFGVVEGGQGNGVTDAAQDELVVAEISGHPFGGGVVRFTGTRYRLADVRLLAPVLPSKVVAVEGTYGGDGQEPARGRRGPVLFFKPSTAVAGPDDPISYPVKLTSRVDYEGELAVVIGRLCREVPPERASDVIFGYACANDVTARDLQENDGQWDRAKAFDSFCPLGPWIETEVDAADLAITTSVNGTVRQQARTSQLRHDVPALIAFISEVMTLVPGDVLLTGTPAGSGPLEVGDEVAVTIENIGTLTSKVVSRD